VRDETATARTLLLRLDEWGGHVAGQHVDVRLTAEDGYSTQRSYSIASAPTAGEFELTVQLLPDGEVSPFLARDYAVGDPIEVRGPVGGWFVWRPEQTEPIVLVAGGSGVVPLMSMLRARVSVDSRTPFHLLYSVRTPRDVYFHAELQELSRAAAEIHLSLLYTREAPPDESRRPQRLVAADLRAAGESFEAAATAYVCGPTGFVEAAADLLLELGLAPERVRTERFGPTGG
jgi:ferredoxin-NADP reductase